MGENKFWPFASFPVADEVVNLSFCIPGRSQWSRGVRRGSAAAVFLGLCESFWGHG